MSVLLMGIYPEPTHASLGSGEELGEEGNDSGVGV